MIRRRIGTAREAAVQSPFSPELRRVPGLRRRVNDVALRGHDRVRHVPFECPAQLAEHHDPEFGEIRVEVPAVVRPDRLTGSRVATDQVPTRSVLADRFLRPVLFAFVLLRQLVDVEMDGPRRAVWIRPVEGVWAGAQPNWNVLDA